MNKLKEYLLFIITLIIIAIMIIVNKELGTKAITISVNSLKEMFLILPPIFLLLGLLDVWVPRETMVKYLGEDSGLKGTVLAFILGSAAAGPLYAAFPISSVFIKKGASFSKVLIFIGAWSTTKIPMLIFEFSSLGVRFALTRLILDIFGIVIIAKVIDKLVNEEEKNIIIKDARSMQ